METTELEWHKNQAQRIRDAERGIRKSEQSIALYWWQAGERLNGVYGFSAGSGGTPDREGNIPFSETAEICALYGVAKPTITSARKFHKLAKDEEQALGVIGDYGTWRNIREGFLPGRSADEAKRRIKERNDRHYRPTPLRSHIMNVDDDIRDALILNGLSDEEAREAVRLFIRQSGWRQIKLIWDNREQLREWHKMKA